MSDLGLSKQELLDVGVMHVVFMINKYPEFVKIRKLIDMIMLIFVIMIDKNNQKISEQFQALSKFPSNPDTKILLPVNEDARAIVKNTGVKFTSTGTVRIMGELYNIAGYELSEVEIIAALYDESGRVIERGVTEVYYLSDDSKYIFQIDIRDAEPFSHYDVIVSVTD